MMRNVPFLHVCAGVRTPMHVDTWSTLHHLHSGRKSVVLVPFALPDEFTAANRVPKNAEETRCPVAGHKWGLLKTLTRLSPEHVLTHADVWHSIKHCPGELQFLLCNKNSWDFFVVGGPPTCLHACLRACVVGVIGHCWTLSELFDILFASRCGWLANDEPRDDNNRGENGQHDGRLVKIF